MAQGPFAQTVVVLCGGVKLLCWATKAAGLGQPSELLREVRLGLSNLVWVQSAIALLQLLQSKFLAGLQSNSWWWAKDVHTLAVVWPAAGPAGAVRLQHGSSTSHY